jgi:RNA polymerase sigma-70 factor (ECF subfamily)
MDKNTPEVNLLAALREGNKDAFNEIYQRYRVNVGNMVYFILKNDEALEDIVQEVFLVLWKGRKTINISSSLENYLVGIARNKANDLIKSGMNHEKYVKARKSTQPTKQLPSDQVEIKNLKEIIYVILYQNCSERDRNAFIYYYLDHLTYAEIAAKLGTTIPNCRAYICRVLKVIRKFFKNNTLFQLCF